MATPTVSYTFSAGATIIASEHNQNMTDLLAALTDGAKDLTINALTANGAATFNGNVTLGNSSSDTLTFTGSAASHFVAATDGTYDLGSATIGWRNLYLTGNSNQVQIKASASTSADYTLTLPVDDGTTSQWIVTDGSGTLSFTNTTTTGKVIDGSTDEIQLRIQGNATQTNPLLTLEKSDGTDVLTVANDGAVVIDATADAIQLRLQGHSTQTNSLLVLEKSDGTDVFTVSNVGQTNIGASGADTSANIRGELDVTRTAGAGTPIASISGPLGGAGRSSLKVYGAAADNGNADRYVIDAGYNGSTAAFRVGNTGVTTITGTLNANGVMKGAATVVTAGTLTATDVSGTFILVANTGAGSVNIQGLANGVAEQVIFVYKSSASNSLVFEHNDAAGTQKILTATSADVTVTGGYGGGILVCDGSNWILIST